MGFLIAGALVLGAILGIFYLKDHFRKPWLARLAYHELTMRLVVVAVFLIALGAMFVVGDMIDFGGPAP